MNSTMNGTNRVVQIQAELAADICSFDVARATCELWGQCDFDEQLAKHFQNGFVEVMPHLFVMAKVIKLPDGRKAWLVTHAVGELALLLDREPFPLEWIAFRRRFDTRLRVYRLSRLRHLAFERLKKELPTYE